MRTEEEMTDTLYWAHEFSWAHKALFREWWAVYGDTLENGTDDDYTTDEINASAIHFVLDHSQLFAEWLHEERNRRQRAQEEWEENDRQWREDPEGAREALLDRIFGVESR